MRALKRAVDFIRDLEHKLVACPCADGLVAHAIQQLPNSALERTAENAAVRSA